MNGAAGFCSRKIWLNKNIDVVDTAAFVRIETIQCYYYDYNIQMK